MKILISKCQLSTGKPHYILFFIKVNSVQHCWEAIDLVYDPLEFKYKVFTWEDVEGCEGIRTQEDLKDLYETSESKEKDFIYNVK